MKNERKKNILHTIINEYIKTANPVSSGLLASKYNLNLSSATIRNEMMALEEEGYIYQPHTSAGRVPSQLAYLFLVEELKSKLVKLKSSDKDKIDSSILAKDLRQAAKSIAEISNNAVFWAFHKNDLYYTGLSNLFSQPEFKDNEVVCDVSSVIDRMEEIIDKIFDGLENKSHVKIGSNNPFGPFLGTVILKYKHNNKSGLVGILGPMRMDYLKNLSLLEYINKKFK